MKVTTSIVHAVDYGDLEEFLMGVYSLSSRFELLESPNDTTHDVGKVAKRDLSDYDQKNLEKIGKNGSAEYCFLYIIFQDLVNKDLIPEGHYQVNVCW